MAQPDRTPQESGPPPGAQPPPPPAQPPKKPTRRTWWIAGGAFILGLVVGMSVESDDQPTQQSPVAQESPVEVEPTMEPEPEPTLEEEPEPDADYTSSCDYLLGDFSESGSGYRFVADARLKNVGNIGVEVKVVATWDLAGGQRVKAVKTVQLPEGKSKRVGFVEVATQDQIDAHQSLGFEQENCRVRATLTDTLGSSG
jgi:hypothetical protein